MLSIDAYGALLCQDVAAVSTHSCSISHALGQVLAADIHARYPVPPFDNSAMDGFAVRAADTEGAGECVEMPVVGDIPAGRAVNQLVPPGCAVRIMTGAAVPPGVDTVVPVEDTDSSPGAVALPELVRLPSAVPQGQHIRRRGEDVEVGQLLATKGSVITPTLISSAISTGQAQVSVYRHVKVAIVSTGDELRDPGEELEVGTIPDSNSQLLAALVAAYGAEVVSVKRLADDRAALARHLERISDVDLLITSGGVSAGAFDVVKLFGKQAGFSFHKVAMQPGKPQGFGSMRVDNHQLKVVTLPGNPVSVFVSFHVLVKPVLDLMSGRSTQWTAIGERLLPARSGADWKAAGKRTQFLPAQARLGSDGLYVFPIHRLGSGSHLVASLHHSRTLAVVPAGVERVVAGDQVSILQTL